MTGRTTWTRERLNEQSMSTMLILSSKHCGWRGNNVNVSYVTLCNYGNLRLWQAPHQVISKALEKRNEGQLRSQIIKIFTHKIFQPYLSKKCDILRSHWSMILRQYCTAASFSPCRLRPSMLVISDDVRPATPPGVVLPPVRLSAWTRAEERGEGRDDGNRPMEGVARELL